LDGSISRLRPVGSDAEQNAEQVRPRQVISQNASDVVIQFGTTATPPIIDDGAAAPEPATLALLAFGFAGIAFGRRRGRDSQL